MVFAKDLPSQGALESFVKVFPIASNNQRHGYESRKAMRCGRDAFAAGSESLRRPGQLRQHRLLSTDAPVSRLAQRSGAISSEGENL
jgi:hypothetical protein